MTEEDRRKIINNLKATPVYPMQTEILPPIGLQKDPTVKPGYPGIQAYFQTALAAFTGLCMSRPDNAVDDALKMTDNFFEALADKLIAEKQIRVVDSSEQRIVTPGPRGRQ